jgi:hypothetical protein
LKELVGNPLAKKKILAFYLKGLSYDNGANLKKVAHTGFEPVISALRGQRPEPLDECAPLLFPV